jgi:hypothetical protein
MEKALQGVSDSDGRPVKFEVINAAVGGYSPYNYWKAYRRWAPVFNPDVVLVGLSPDDYECSNETAKTVVEPDEGGRISIKKLRKWLSWNSEFYILMRNFLYYNDLVGRMVVRANPGGVENDSQLESYMALQPENIRRVWSKAFSYLQNLREEASAAGVLMILIRIPLKMEIDSEEYRHVLVGKGLKNEQMDLDQPLREISAFCKAENMPLLDPPRRSGSVMLRYRATLCTTDIGMPKGFALQLVPSQDNGATWDFLPGPLQKSNLVINELQNLD